jgi:uncharacterized membrane protein
MNWQALWNDGAIISAHAIAAMAAMALGLVQFALAKGTTGHRLIGYAWIALMATVALSSFWIHEFRWVGPFSGIHLLSLLTLATLVYSVRAARMGRVEAHRASMRQLFLLALVLTGAFTLVPGRTMHAVLFGA